jgi:MerR family transcriptional regulator, light-induced transcriptional regulator
MSDEHQARYPVRIVAVRSGVSPHVLRAWERRYQAVTPVRSSGGQRLYSDLDIERVRLLRRLTAQGHPIGSVARLPFDELEQLATREAAALSSTPARKPIGDGQAPQFRSAAVEAARSLDGAELRAVLERATVSLGVPTFLDHVAGPSIRDIGHGWEQGRISVGQEHLATSVFRQVLQWIIDTFQADPASCRILVATPSGQLHELGALLAGAAAASEGWDVVYLGTNVPASDIVGAASQAGVSAVALSVVPPTEQLDLLAELRAIRAGLHSKVHLFLGGSAVTEETERFTGPGVRAFDSLEDFRATLRGLAAAPVSD